MEDEKKIAYIGHYAVDQPVFRETLRYLEGFPDVALRLASGTLPSFPTTVSEITIDYLLKYATEVDEPFFEAMKAAEKEGFKAAVTASFGDFGVARARAELSIPCIGMAWANYAKAREVGGTFSVFHTHIPETLDFAFQQLQVYGFSDYCASVELFDVDIYRWLATGEKPDLGQLAHAALPLVRKCMEKGARAIVIGCGSPDLSIFAQALNDFALKEYGIPVLAPIATAIQVARDMLAGSRPRG